MNPILDKNLQIFVSIFFLNICLWKGQSFSYTLLNDYLSLLYILDHY